MIATAIIFAAMIAVWLYLSHNLRLPESMNGYSFDINGQAWSFLWFFDRYRNVMRDVLWITVAAMVAAVYSHNIPAFWLLAAAFVDNVMLQGLMLFWYELFTHSRYMTQGAAHRFTYTPRKYAAVLTMSVALPIYFFLGVLLTATAF